MLKAISLKEIFFCFLIIKSEMATARIYFSQGAIISVTENDVFTFYDSNHCTSKCLQIHCFWIVHNETGKHHLKH